MGRLTRNIELVAAGGAAGPVHYQMMSNEVQALDGPRPEPEPRVVSPEDVAALAAAAAATAGGAVAASPAPGEEEEANCDEEGKEECAPQWS